MALGSGASASRGHRLLSRVRPGGWLPVVVAAVLVMGSLAGLTVLAVDRSATAVTRQVEGRAQDATASAGAFVRAEVRLLEQLVTSYAQQPLVRAAVAAETGHAGPSELTAALSQLQQSVPGLVAAFVSDESGVLLTTHLGASPNIGENLGYRDWYRGARTGTEPYLSPGFVARNAARTPGFAVSVAVSASDARDAPVVGVLAISMSLSAFSDVFDEAAPRGGSMLVTDQNGQVLASPGTPRPLLSDQSGDPGVRAAIEGRSTFHREDGWVQAHAPLGHGWTVSTTLPASLADRPNAQLATAIGAAGAGVGLCMLGALLLLARVLRSRARAERELAAALGEVERRDRDTHTVLDTLDVSVVVCDRNGTLTYFNRLARAWHSIDEVAPDSEVETWGSRYPATHVDGSPVADHEWPLVRALRTGEPASAELLLSAAGQQPRRTVVLARPLLAVDGSVLGAVSGAHDVTAIRRQEAELEQARDTAMQASRAKTSFLAAMSHEIRTPLNGVLGMIDLVLYDPALPGLVRERLQVAAASGQTLLRLLNDVLDMSRADATRLTLDRRPTDVGELVRSAVAVLSGPAEVKGLTLSVVLDPCLPDRTSTDPDRLTQILLNLVGNAVKFTDSGAVTVTATTEPADDPAAGGPGSEARDLVLRVTDSGPGMTPEDAQRIFRPFEQGAAGLASGGAGLGLALTAQLVELFAGRIAVQSEPGRGSTFTVTLPLVQAARTTPRTRSVAPPAPQAAAPQPATPQPATPEPAAPGQAAPVPPLHVLLAEDNLTNQLVMKHTFATLGITVEVVGDGAQAVERVLTGAPLDAVFLDWQMPVMDGPQAATALRAAGVTVPLIGLTARTSPQDVQACLDAGMDRVLPKPFALQDLISTLRDLAAGLAPQPQQPDRTLVHVVPHA